MGSSFLPLFKPRGFGSSLYSTYDPDAQAFFNKQTSLGQALTGTEKTATNQLVLDYKAAGLWTGTSLIYPLLGGTLTSCSVNLKNPDLYQVTWFGTVTANSNGVTGDGLTGYGDTGFSADLLAQDSHSFGSYSRTDSDGVDVDFSPYAELEIIPRLGGTTYFDDQFPTTRVTAGSANSLGLFGMSRTGANALNGYKNGGSIASTAGASSAIVAKNFSLLAAGQNAGVPFRPSARNIAFAYAAAGLNGTQNANLYTAIQAFQTTLGRQV